MRILFGDYFQWRYVIINKIAKIYQILKAIHIKLLPVVCIVYFRLLKLMKNNTVAFLRTLTLLFAGALMGIWFSNENLGGHRFFLNGDDKIQRVMKLVHSNYVDSVNMDSLEGQTVNQVLQNLDPHSLYLPPQRAQSINERLDGGFNGVGIEYLVLRDTLVITQVYDGGPAQQAGIKPGDRVIDINNKKFSGTHLTQTLVNKTFSNAKDSEMELSVISPAGKSIKVYHIKRGHVDLSSLDASYIAAPSVGYIKSSKFASTTDTDFRSALKKLKTEGMQKLVLDLRGNGGGYLNSATELASEFLDKGKLIVYTKGIHEPR